MFTIAGGIVLGFGAIWLILYLVAHSGEIGEFINELPKLLLALAGLMTVILLPAWLFRQLPDVVRGVLVCGGFLLLVIGFVCYAIRDFRRWRSSRRA